MRQSVVVGLGLALVSMVSMAIAAELQPGLKEGDKIGAFQVFKIAGAASDNVEVGTKLCYRCKYSTRPMVMVFARSSDDKLAALVTQLDKAVAANSDKQLRAFVNFLGEDRAALEKTAQDLVEKTKATNVPSVVPEDFQNGPKNYSINPEADVTIIVATNNIVTANHALPKGGLNDAVIKQVAADLAKITAE